MGYHQDQITEGLRKIGRRIAFHPFIHPTRFYGDLQRETNTTNYNRTLLDYLSRFRRGQRVLDLGSGGRTLGSHILSLDISLAGRVDVVGDGHTLPFRDGMFDGVVLQQVLEHVTNPIGVLGEVKRVLAINGSVYIEVPFLYPVHDQKHDYWRWTDRGLDLMASKLFTREALGVIMGGSSALSIVLRDYVACLISRNRRPLYGGVCTAVGLLTWWVKYLDEWVGVDRGNIMRNTAAGYYFIGKK